LNASITFAEGLLESPYGPGFNQIQLHALQLQAEKVLFSSQTSTLDRPDFIHELLRASSDFSRPGRGQSQISSGEQNCPLQTPVKIQEKVVRW
jgi:hypothetical protein